MTSSINQQILLKSRPLGEPKESDFALVETPILEPGEGEVLNRTIYLSLDPYMRGRESYAAPVELGSVMVGGTVSQVIKSNHPQFSTGDFVLGYDGWQAYGISKGETLRKLDPNQACISYALGVTGMPGMTTYFQQFSF
ncbi:hypothetical protein LC612_39475 [Nostoc sp. CHAB 5834]|nr:hypothetical protein [Nostoc sp. CHAB 5834]